MSPIDRRPEPVKSKFMLVLMDLLPRGVGFFWSICILPVLSLSLLKSELSCASSMSNTCRIHNSFQYIALLFSDRQVTRVNS